MKGVILSIFAIINAVMVVIGCISWGLYGLFGFDLIELFCIKFLVMPSLTNVIYTLIGQSGIVLLFKFKSFRDLMSIKT
jgi:uncharacterized membrane protein YuzA (DUF378 family)